MRNRKNKKSKFIILLILVLAVSLGYALLSTDLKIGGVAGISKKTWDIYWDNISNKSGVTPIVEPVIGEDAEHNLKTLVTYTVALNEPGDFYEFTVDAVNNGGLDAMITEITNSVTPQLPTFMNVIVTYADGGAIDKNQLLPKKVGNTASRETYRIRVEFKKDVSSTELSNIPDEGVEYTFTFGVTYGQADETAITRAPGLDNVSWSTIASNISSNPQIYPVGSSKTVDMGKYGIHSVRIVNNTTPDECNTAGFSQSACGVVWDFSDIITTHYMNINKTPNGNGTATVGGWEYSDMRAFVSGEIYNNLPSDLKDVIGDTEVVSIVYGGFATTTDKLYLLELIEVHKEAFNYNDSYGNNVPSRLLKYYEDKYVAISNGNPATVKKFGTVPYAWWLRSADNQDNYSYQHITDTGHDPGTSGYYSDLIRGISPAFKLKVIGG